MSRTPSSRKTAPLQYLQEGLNDIAKIEEVLRANHKNSEKIQKVIRLSHELNQAIDDLPIPE
jgi:hypothetical protein